MTTELVVASWNILAAPWAAPAYYPAEMDPSLLERGARRELVATALAGLGADLVCLQETTPVDLAAIVAALGDGVAVHTAPNGRELWASWSTDELPWEANGTAILWRTDRLDAVETGGCPLSRDGNVATTVRARLRGTDTHVRAISVHLDVDDRDLRREQLGVACAWSGPSTVGTVDVVAGDCNEDTSGTELGTILTAAGFADALTVAGNAEPTHPLARPTDDYAPLARLDHVLARGATVSGGRVEDAGVWAVDGPGDRMIEGLARTGSDHLAVVATLAVPA